MYYGKDNGISSSSDISRDDFWDISELIPKKKKTSPAPLPNPSRLADLSPERCDGGSSRGERERRIVFSATGASAPSIEEYSPESNRLITRVRLRPSGSGYNFYERFKNDAVRLHSQVGTECPAVSFFSYIPQYSQMDRAQLDYYLWFRERARHGEAVECDVGYVFLYIYEIINLSGDLISPEDGLRQLCALWRLYHKQHPKINKFLSQWICDYCLIYRLPCPVEQLDEVLPVILSQASFREFYLGGAMGLTDRCVSAIVSLLSDYDWRKSRCSVGREKLFERHIHGSMDAAMRLILSGDFGRHLGGISPAHRSIRAFEGSLCANSFRTVIEVEYRSFSDTPELRFAVTNALKYAENKLRAHLRVRSRLSAQPTPEVMSAIDAYFARALRAEKPDEPMPEYERRYSAPDVATSFSDASELERLSWTVTRRLVPEGELEETGEGAQSASATDTEPESVLSSCILPQESSVAEESSLGELERGYLSALLCGDTAAARRVLREARALEDSVVEQINEAADSILGDIVLMPSDDGYTIVEEYLEEVRQWTIVT